MFKKIFKKIRKVIKPLGKAFKKVMKPFAKIQQKLGPVGTMALMFIAPYALPAIWGAFGAWAGVSAGAAAGGAASFQALAPGIQTLMKGIYAAGTKIGAAYNTVTGFISDTVGKIAGNTIGKIPIGAEGKTLGSMWSNFTDNLSMKMAGKNLELGKNIDKSFNVATGKVDFVKDALSKIKTPGLSADLSMGEQVSRSLLDVKPVNLTSAVGEATSTKALFRSASPLVDGSFSNLSLSSSPVISGDYDITGLATSKFDSAAALQNLNDDPFIDVMTGLKKNKISLDAKYGKGSFGKAEIDRLTPDYTQIRESVLKANPQLKAEAESLKQYLKDINGVSDPYIDTGILYEPTQIAQARMKETADKAFNVVDKAAGLIGDQTEADRAQAEFDARQAQIQNMQLAQSIAPIGYSGIQDFSSDFSNLSNTYSAAGYGPETNFTTGQSQYEAGAYGGAGFMNQVSSRFLQPTIGMPRLA